MPPCTAPSPAEQRPWRSWCRLLIFTVCLASVASPCWAASPRVAPEYQLKAAFVLNFARFVEWPRAAVSAEGDHFRVDIVGEDPFVGLIDSMLEEQQVQGHGVSVHRPRDLERLEGCRLLFVGVMDPEQLAELFARLDGLPILTVGESEQFQRLGGIIRLKLVRGRVRFEINRTAAERAGLKISSKLLKLAENT